jgi:hypothetical protein
LFGSNFIEGRKNSTGVAGAAIIHKGSVDGLDSGGALFVRRLGFGLRGSTLWLARAIDGLGPFVRCMLFAEWCRMVELQECSIGST